MLVICCRILKTGRPNSNPSRLRTYHPSFNSFPWKNERRRLKNNSPSALRSANKSLLFRSNAPNTSPRNERNALVEHKTVLTSLSQPHCESSSRKKESDRALLFSVQPLCSLC